MLLNLLGVSILFALFLLILMIPGGAVLACMYFPLWSKFSNQHPCGSIPSPPKKKQKHSIDSHLYTSTMLTSPPFIHSCLRRILLSPPSPLHNREQAILGCGLAGEDSWVGGLDGWCVVAAVVGGEGEQG
ncbi:hypothetical protein BKA64DRAFT_651581 [Cadophora sp. MPI-SDFR-AT-0126]|nr:hypothetical protein BKA64DRAFT_651581 [Leotiomycetes sp. MPI-SDFR-AT-0126]